MFSRRSLLMGGAAMMALGGLKDGLAVERFRIDWRGPLAFVSWRDGHGRTFRRSLWPDTLSAAGRRELRLAADRDDAGRRPGPMAP